MNGVANGVYGGDLPNQINTPWIDFSEQSTIVGWSSFTSKQIRYKIAGNIVYVYFNIQGTSNSTSTTFTLPIQPKLYVSTFGGFGADNGASQVSAFGQASIPSNTITAYRYTSFTVSTTTWTASGTKNIIGQFFYEI